MQLASNYPSAPEPQPEMLSDQRELEARFVLENGDLFLPLISTAQSEESREELASGIDFRYLKIDVIQSHRSSHFLA